jgi:hypothetical protein
MFLRACTVSLRDLPQHSPGQTRAHNSISDWSVWTTLTPDVEMNNRDAMVAIKIRALCNDLHRIHQQEPHVCHSWTMAALL